MQMALRMLLLRVTDLWKLRSFCTKTAADAGLEKGFTRVL